MLDRRVDEAPAGSLSPSQTAQHRQVQGLYSRRHETDFVWLYGQTVGDRFTCRIE
jgi:hypothetical protein